ncbi:MAG: outer membrane beta-barrel protein [Candidatus Acidiferrales bacterium]
MRRILFGIMVASVAATFMAPSACAQTPDNYQFPKFEIIGGYSSIETNNHTFSFGPNFKESDTDFDESGWGFEAGVIRNFNRYFGILGDFSAHFSHDQGPATFMISPCNPLPSCSVTENTEINPRLFDFLGGPEFKWRNRTRLTPFAHALFGVAHTTATFKAAGPAIRLSRTDADTGFAMTYGGGLQIGITGRLGIRLSLDYGKAFVGSSALPPQRVNSLGWSAGIVFH